MIILDEPFVSDFVLQTIRDNGLPVLENKMARSLNLCQLPACLSTEAAGAAYRSGDIRRLYTTSEHALGWISEHLADTDLPEKVGMFKNKVRFRELSAGQYPDLYYLAVDAGDLASVDINQVPFPFIIKPAVGFFSLGVHKVSTPDQWPRVRDAILLSLSTATQDMPTSVLDNSQFIIEGVIDGEEYAVDAYYDSSGNPVVLNILEHLFASEHDVSDRVYVSSREIVMGNLGPIEAYLKALGRWSGLRDFPVHVELRRTGAGDLVPIEVNPLRFGGWCTTADMTAVAYGFNPYLYYFNDRKPGWDEIFRQRPDDVYSIIVLDNTTGVPGSQINGFNYDGVGAALSCPLQIRSVDFRKHPVFGFVFAKTPAHDMSELENMLTSDLTEFLL